MSAGTSSMMIRMSGFVALTRASSELLTGVHMKRTSHCDTSPEAVKHNVVSPIRPWCTLVSGFPSNPGATAHTISTSGCMARILMSSPLSEVCAPVIPTFIICNGDFCQSATFCGTPPWPARAIRFRRALPGWCRCPGLCRESPVRCSYLCRMPDLRHIRCGS